MYIRINAVPGAKKERIVQVSDNKYDISVKEPAEQNMANNRIREIIGELFLVSKNQVKIISGHRSPHKIFSIPDKNEVI